MILLETKKINLSFAGIQVMTDVDFQLKAGEIHCLCGENGAGKSCLVKVLTGIYNHYQGEIYVEGKGVRLSDPIMARQAGIYAVQQHRDLVPTLNAVENTFMGNEIFKSNKGKQRLDFDEMKKRTRELIAKFGVEIDLDVPVRDLRVSEQGIIAICKALATESKVLLIDEASAPLDSAERKNLYAALKKLRDEGKGIVYISHHLEEIFAIGERITVLRNGKNVCVLEVENTDSDTLISAMTGNKKMYSREEGSKQYPENEIPVMEFHNVSNNKIKNVSFSVRKGEVVGFAGLEGSHKDEIANIAFGLEKYNSGEVCFKGKCFTTKHPIDSIKLGIGLVPTDRKNLGLITCRSVSENIILTAINKYNKSIINPGWVKNVVHKMIKSLAIKTSGPGQIVEYLSGGNQQKVLVSKWMEAGVEVLFLVEPTEGIDVGSRWDLYKKIKEIAAEGTAMVIFTSDIDELITLSDRIYTMVDGSVVNEYDVQVAEKNTILTDILSRHSERGESIA